MGLMGALTGLGGIMRNAEGLAEVFVANKTKENAAQHAEYLAALAQLAAEFEHPRENWFDATISGLNRLPRPALACGTLGLFVYAMADPIGFADRMQGLELVPEPLWWLLGAIVSFYFGAREMHYFRNRRPSVALNDLLRVNQTRDAIDAMRPVAAEDATPRLASALPARRIASVDPDFNAAIEDWHAAQG